MTDAHDQRVTRRYMIHVPEHGPRATDPFYADFEEYKRKRKISSYYCDFAAKYRGGDTSECDMTKPLECHHKHIEYAMQNGVDLALLEKDYPGVSSMGIGKWIESADNLELLCVVHHRAYAGVHTVSASDIECLKYFRDLLGKY